MPQLPYFTKEHYFRIALMLSVLLELLALCSYYYDTCHVSKSWIMGLVLSGQLCDD